MFRWFHGDICWRVLVYEESIHNHPFTKFRLPLRPRTVHPGRTREIPFTGVAPSLSFSSIARDLARDLAIAPFDATGDLAGGQWRGHGEDHQGQIHQGRGALRNDPLRGSSAGSAQGLQGPLFGTLRDVDDGGVG